jgi:hypothetical protein
MINEIKKHMDKSGYPYHQWYVGIAKDARDALFNRHGVRERGDWWIFRKATTTQQARDIESYFLNTLRTAGGSGGGDNFTTMVYAYKIGSHTNQ